MNSYRKQVWFGIAVGIAILLLSALLVNALFWGEAGDWKDRVIVNSLAAVVGGAGIWVGIRIFYK